MSKVRVYALYASLKAEEPSPWMVACEDEFSWEGNPDRCEKIFQDARNLCDENDFDYREITFLVNYSLIASAFSPAEFEVEVERTDAA